VTTYSQAQLPSLPTYIEHRCDVDYRQDTDNFADPSPTWFNASLDKNARCKKNSKNIVKKTPCQGPSTMRLCSRRNFEESENTTMNVQAYKYSPSCTKCYIQPAATARETSARDRAGPSLVPSPTKQTRWPLACNATIAASLSSGVYAA